MPSPYTSDQTLEGRVWARAGTRCTLLPSPDTRLPRLSANALHSHSLPRQPHVSSRETPSVEAPLLADPQAGRQSAFGHTHKSQHLLSALLRAVEAWVQTRQGLPRVPAEPAHPWPLI